MEDFILFRLYLGIGEVGGGDILKLTSVDVLMVYLTTLNL